MGSAKMLTSRDINLHIFSN